MPFAKSPPKFGGPTAAIFGLDFEFADDKPLLFDDDDEEPLLPSITGSNNSDQHKLRTNFHYYCFDHFDSPLTIGALRSLTTLAFFNVVPF